MAQGRNIDLIVYVTGAPFQVTVNPNQKIEHLIREAFKEAGKQDTEPTGWALRLLGGGDPLPLSTRIGDAGITDGVELTLDRDEGGGGNAAASAGAARVPPPVLVAPEVSRAKLARQVDAFRANAESYRRRGIVLLAHDDLVIDVGFQCRLPLDDVRSLAAMPVAVRFEFSNYDVWAPSLDFIDPITREPLPHPPIIHGLAFRENGAPIRGGPVNVFVEGHPKTKRTFVCKRGVREYHSHFEHNGDDWLLHRGDDLGTLAQLVEVLWRHTTRTVTGLHVVAQRVQLGNACLSAFQLELRREDVDALAEQLGPQLVEAERMQQAALAQPGDFAQQVAQQAA